MPNGGETPEDLDIYIQNENDNKVVSWVNINDKNVITGISLDRDDMSKF